MYKILMIEDDHTIANVVSKHLSSWNYEVQLVTDFKNIMSLFLEYKPQLVLMDITLPFMNGYYFCSEIRKLSTIPIIFLSSAADNMNIVMAMNMGADDFISKPFDLTVLTAKISALFRRSYSFSNDINILQHNDVILNLTDATLNFKQSSIELTKNELKILQVLFEQNRKIVSREDLMLRLWNSDSFIDDNTLTVNMTRLRRKLTDLGLQDFIQTKKGLGYKIE